MIYKDFENIDIENALGVSPVGDDTKLIAEEASKLPSYKILEIGTGTGFIAIFLIQKGKLCEAYDKNPLAVELAQKNAAKNGIKLSVNTSDLFEDIQGLFDLIIFNPPFGDADSVRGTKYLEIIKSVIPRRNPLIARLSFLLIKNKRQSLIAKFLKESKKHLESNGSILILLDKSELSLTDGFISTTLQSWKNMQLVLLRPQQSL